MAQRPPKAPTKKHHDNLIIIVIGVVGVIGAYLIYRSSSSSSGSTAPTSVIPSYTASAPYDDGAGYGPSTTSPTVATAAPTPVPPSGNLAQWFGSAPDLSGGGSSFGNPPAVGTLQPFTPAPGTTVMSLN